MSMGERNEAEMRLVLHSAHLDQVAAAMDEDPRRAEWTRRLAAGEMLDVMQEAGGPRMQQLVGLLAIAWRATAMYREQAQQLDAIRRGPNDD